MDARVDARLPAGLLDRLDAEAERERRRRSEMVRLLIEEALDARQGDPLRAGSDAWRAERVGVHREPVGSARDHPFRPQPQNALRCDECGGKKGDHRG